MKNPRRRTILTSFAIAAASLLLVALTAAWYWKRTGGWYGVEALIDGHNPLGLVPPTPQGVNESHARGDKIVTAIHAFHVKHNRYPAQLEDLVPEFLAEIEPPTVGACEWEYRIDENGAFVLGFFVGPSYERDWHEGGGGWHHDR